MKKGSRQHKPFDEHDTPTEPMPAVLFPPSDQDNFLHGGEVAPAPFLSHQLSSQNLSIYPYNQASLPDIVRPPSYPFLSGTPPGTNYRVWPGDTTWYSGKIKKRQARRRSLLPACVGLVFLCVQLLLFVRLGIIFLGLTPDIAWVGVTTNVSEIFVLPFWVLWLQIPRIGGLLPANMEVYTLIAIVAYGVLSRLLVGILKVMLKSR